MKAVVYYGPGDVRLEERPYPKLKKNNLIVKVTCCAICGTDLKLATIGNPRFHPPRIIGHEMVGKIFEIGSDLSGFSIGDRITLATTISCGNCYYCKLGLGNICPNARPISCDFDGAFAEYLLVPHQAIIRGNVIKVPDSVSDEAAALSEPLSCAINAQEIAGVKPGDNVVIIGGGPLGALHAGLAKALGASEVIIVQRSEPRLTYLKRLKDVIVVDSENEDVSSIIKERTNGLGADIVIVCAPDREIMEKSIFFTRKGGTVSLFASLPKENANLTFNSRIIHYGELRIVGSSDSRPEHVIKAVELLSKGKINTDVIITHKIALEDIFKGIELMKNSRSLKILVYPGKVKK